MKSLLGGMLIVTGAVAVAVGVLVGVERLLQSDSGKRRRRREVAEPVPAAEVPPIAATAQVTAAPPLVETPQRAEALPIAPASQAVATPTVAEIEPVPKKVPDRNFSIKRTKSEVGYVYWILEGHGKYKCFVLCDSWDEAVAQAKAKLAEVDAVDETTQVPAGAQPVSMSA